VEELHKWDTADNADVVEMPATGDVFVPQLLPPLAALATPPPFGDFSGFIASFKGNFCFI